MQEHGFALGHVPSLEVLGGAAATEHASLAQESTQEVSLTHPTLFYLYSLPAHVAPVEFATYDAQAASTSLPEAPVAEYPSFCLDVLLPPECEVDTEEGVPETALLLVEQARTLHDRGMLEKSVQLLELAYFEFDRVWLARREAEVLAHVDDLDGVDVPALSERPRFADEVAMEVFLLLSVAAVQQSMGDDEQALTTLWQAKLSLDMLHTMWEHIRQQNAHNDALDEDDEDGEQVVSLAHGTMLESLLDLRPEEPLAGESIEHFTVRDPHPAQGTVYDMLGLSCANLGLYDVALRCFSAACSLRFQALDPATYEYVDVSTSLCNLGVCLFHLGERRQSLLYLDAARELAASRLDAAHPRMSLIAQNLQRVGEVVMVVPPLLRALRPLPIAPPVPGGKKKKKKKGKAKGKSKKKGKGKDKAKAKGGKAKKKKGADAEVAPPPKVEGAFRVRMERLHTMIEAAAAKRAKNAGKKKKGKGKGKKKKKKKG